MQKQFSYQCVSCNHTALYTPSVAHCPNCGEEWLEPVYDFEEAAHRWQTELNERDRTIWRYWEMLPLLDDQHIVSMGEGWTPLLPVAQLGSMLGHNKIFIKDERQGPTTSFKDRQASLAVSMMREADIDKITVASTGNVAISYSAYCARAGIRLWAFLNNKVPNEKVREVRLYGTTVVQTNTTYDKTKQIAALFAKHRGIYLERGLKGIAAREAMKTLGFEIAEQLGKANGKPWDAPDWFIQAVSGGMGPIGVWKGFHELYRMGLVNKIPKIAVIQTEGCAPMVDSYHKGLDVAEEVTNPTSVINVLATGSPGRGYQYLRGIVQNHGGAFVKVSDEASFKAMRDMAQLEGLSMEPAAAVACAGLIEMIENNMIGPDETVVINASGHTFPIEKQILEKKIIKSHTRMQVLDDEVIDEIKPDAPPLRQEGLLSALERLDDRVQNIAIIEDEPDARVLLRRILEFRRYKVAEAADGAEGIKLLKDNKPDLVLLDLMMPHMDGFAVLDMMEADDELRDIPVIVITAKDLTNNEYQRLSGKVESLLQKGEYLEDELFDRISNVR